MIGCIRIIEWLLFKNTTINLITCSFKLQWDCVQLGENVTSVLTEVETKCEFSNFAVHKNVLVLAC